MSILGLRGGKESNNVRRSTTTREEIESSLRALANILRGHPFWNGREFPGVFLAFAYGLGFTPWDRNCRSLNVPLPVATGCGCIHTKAHSRLKVLFSSAHLRIHLSSSGLPFHQPPPSLPPIIFITTCSQTPQPHPQPPTAVIVTITNKQSVLSSPFQLQLFLVSLPFIESLTSPPPLLSNRRSMQRIVHHV